MSAEQDLEQLRPYLEPLTVPAGRTLAAEGEHADALYFITSGEARLERSGIQLSPLGPGAAFGEIGFLSGAPRVASVVAHTEMKLARLSTAGYQRLLAEQPVAGVKLLERLVVRLGGQLVEMTDRVGQLLKERSLPRRTEVLIRRAAFDGPRFLNGDGYQRVLTGTPMKALLPPSVGGRPVVAGLLDYKPVSLNLPIYADATIAPLTDAHWEGRAIYRQSVGLAFLEAAHRVAPGLAFQLGAIEGPLELVELGEGALPADCRDREELAARIEGELLRLIRAETLFREEWWTTEEAATHFKEQGWPEAMHLLKIWRAATVQMVSCGSLYAMALSPMLASTAAIAPTVRVSASEAGLLLDFGDQERPAQKEGCEPRAEAEHGTMAREHQRWLSGLKVESVGDFNDLCVSGQVPTVIRAAEGFHEKRIGRIADEIAERAGVLRVIAIAGPSSSGKTTFIKRLTVQLQINGIRPHAISLDDYYLDRERSPRDEHGELDFESIEALDLALWRSHIARLLGGETLKTAKYDFLSGKSLPDRGPELRLDRSDVLLIEGIHGLNPRLREGVLGPEQAFRIFIHPVTVLPFDPLSRVSATDVRLIRRIVRDRHGRNYKAQENILRWPSVLSGEGKHIYPYETEADVVFDSSLVYELSVLKVFADRYLLEVPVDHPAYITAFRLRQVLDRFVTIYPDHVPPTSMIREFIGGSGFEY